jgi:hypothetical protein
MNLLLRLGLFSEYFRPNACHYQCHTPMHDGFGVFYFILPLMLDKDQLRLLTFALFYQTQPIVALNFHDLCILHNLQKEKLYHCFICIFITQLFFYVLRSCAYFSELSLVAHSWYIRSRRSHI